MLTRTADAIVSWQDDRHGPLPALLLVLTMITGLVDAVSYLELGHVFVANMTGNVVFLGFAVADAQDFSIPASLVAITAFLAGALAGGRLGSSVGQHRARFLASATRIQIALVGVALVISAVVSHPDGNAGGYALIALLALAMGLQNATARRLGVPGAEHDGPDIDAYGTRCRFNPRRREEHRHRPSVAGHGQHVPGRCNRRFSHPPLRYQLQPGSGVGATGSDRDFSLPIVFIIGRVDRGGVTYGFRMLHAVMRCRSLPAVMAPGLRRQIAGARRGPVDPAR